VAYRHRGSQAKDGEAMNVELLIELVYVLVRLFAAGQLG
jgi:hypothetical protein